MLKLWSETNLSSNPHSPLSPPNSPKQAKQLNLRASGPHLYNRDSFTHLMSATLNVHQAVTVLSAGGVEVNGANNSCST